MPTLNLTTSFKHIEVKCFQGIDVNKRSRAYLERPNFCAATSNSKPRSVVATVHLETVRPHGKKLLAVNMGRHSTPVRGTCRFYEIHQLIVNSIYGSIKHAQL